MSSCVKFVFRISALTFTCWLDNVLRSKMRFITWLLPMIHNKHTPFSLHSIFLLSVFPLFSLCFMLFLSFSPCLPLWLCIFLSSFFLCLWLHSLSAYLPLHSLLMTLLPICLSFFYSASVHLSWAEIGSHTWERTNYTGSPRALF